MTKQRVVLNMIVKNEAAVIRRCLESVWGHVTDVVVLDGGTDQTPDIIRDFCYKHGLGCLVRREQASQPFDFAAARNRALALAKDYLGPDLDNAYLYFLDADDILHYTPTGRGLARFTADSYTVEYRFGQFRYYKRDLVKASLSWTWKYPYHEVLMLPGQEPTQDMLPDAWVEYCHDGVRSKDPTTHVGPAEGLAEYAKENPEDTRSAFYAAQEYAAAGHVFQALDWYKERVKRGRAGTGFTDEVYISWYQIGLLATQVGEALTAYQMGIQFRPYRLECYWAAAHLCQTRGWDALARMYCDAGVKVMADTRSKEGLFVDVSARNGLGQMWKALNDPENSTY